MLRTSLVLLLALFVVVSCETYAQDSRAQQLAVSLDKNKYKKKEKANISIEIYIDIKNELAVRNAPDYAGTYWSEDGDYRMTLSVDASGAASGTGQDMINGDRHASFTLRDARIEGALLTGTKVYDNGEQQRFEAVFVNRTVSNGKNANDITSRDTKFGLGFIQNGNWADKEGRTTSWTSRVFLEKR